MRTLDLPVVGGGVEAFTMPAAPPWEPARGPFNRIAYAAAHVVAAPDDPSRIDWDATLRFRHYLWDCGLGVAEAMDTAQRGMGLEWTHARELVARTCAAARATPGALVVSGCGTDHLDPAVVTTVEQVVAAYEHQMEAIEREGGQIVLMASRALRQVASGPGDYVHVYGQLLRQAREPVVLHWLGSMFDPQLDGYWGSTDLDLATDTVMTIVAENAAKVDGIKISLLDADREVRMRRRLPPGVRMYTGDDFGFAELIAGDERGHSDALLGIFDAIAPAASAALEALASDDRDRYDAILGPCVSLSRHVFEAPTRYYKTGLVFLAWLNGHQDDFAMLDGQERRRSLTHLAELFRLAASARVLRHPDLAIERMHAVCDEAGVA